ncbi:MAG: hypothetical protein P1U64_12345 [Alcanivoracaceae bacterium]|nr:hypothetical protein [Alcanivoracaceae bacterium]
MSTEKKLNGKAIHFFVGLYGFCQKWWLKYGLLPLLFLGGPLFVIGILEGDGPLSSFGVDLEEFKRFHLWIYLSCAVLVFAYSSLPALIKEAIDGAPNMTLRRAMLLIECFEKIVETKFLRFNGELEDIKKTSGAHGADIFNRITKPDQQIAFIVQIIYTFIAELDSSIGFKVRLIEVCPDSGAAQDYFYYVPQDSHPSHEVERLNERETLYMAAIKKNEMVVVEDIGKELRKTSRNFVKFNSESGSALCFPMVCKGRKYPVFVLSITADKSGFFKNKEKKLYNWILYKFAQRVCLEYTLLCLKEGQEDETSAS